MGTKQTKEIPVCIDLDTGIWVQASPGVFIVVKRDLEDQIVVSVMSQDKKSDNWHEWDLAQLNPKEVTEKVRMLKGK